LMVSYGLIAATRAVGAWCKRLGTAHLARSTVEGLPTDAKETSFNLAPDKD